MSKTIILFFAFLSTTAAIAQNTIVGTVIDPADKSPLIGVNLLLTSPSDTTAQYFATSGIDGSFTFSKVKRGTYTLSGSYVGYVKLEKSIKVEGRDLDLGNVLMEQDSEMLEELKVVGQSPMSVQLGDTTQFNAQAFKTNPDASAEDLVRKMPGITVENGTIKAQGEDVQRVLVDGKPFFGDDPSSSLKNLPAEIIDKVQVLDQLSEQAQFTGYDDGNRTKTINIITKPNSRSGVFGRISGGYGTDDRYGVGGNLNIFKGDRRLTVLGMVNNISQLNFASEDLGGVSGGGGFGGRGRGGNNFYVGQQSGFTTTESAGLNFSDKWGDKVEITGSYFFNHTNNINSTVLNREYILAADSSQYYTESNLSERGNYNHRVDVRLDYKIDSFNSITIRPRLNLQQSDSRSGVMGETSFLGGGLINSMSNNQLSSSSALNFSNDILYRHSFRKAGRTISLNVNTGIVRNDGDNLLDATNSYYTDDIDRVEVVDQETVNVSDRNSITANAVYTEPIGKKSQVMLEYRISYDESNSKKSVYDMLQEGAGGREIDSTLSNNFENSYITNAGGVGYSTRGEKSRLRIGLNYQEARLSGTQLFPYYEETEKTFANLLPSLMYSYDFSKQDKLNIFYRTSTSAPSISQLQDVIDNTNPLQLRTGNPDLKQRYSHTFMTRFSSTNPQKSSNTFVMINANYTTDYITNATYTAQNDSLLSDGIMLYKGSRLIKPVNVGSSWSVRSYYSYGTPLSVIKSNLNLGTGISYSNTPGLINTSKNTSQTFQVSQSVVLSSNISQNLDFTISSSANYNIVKNTLQPGLNNNYLSQSNGVKFKWIFWKGFTIENDLTHTWYAGLGDEFDRSVLLMNIGIGKRLFKGDRGEIKISIFDLLNQNDNIQRTVNETYIEDRRTQSIQRYAMLTFSYNLRQFSGGR